MKVATCVSRCSTIKRASGAAVPPSTAPKHAHVVSKSPRPLQRSSKQSWLAISNTGTTNACGDGNDFRPHRHLTLFSAYERGALHHVTFCDLKNCLFIRYLE